MKSTLASVSIIASLATSAVACSTVSNVIITFYGYPDNSPPGAGIAYDCGRGYTAGGTGTYSDPLTFATAPGEFNKCEILYLPYIQKYVRFEDTCAQCTTDYSNGQLHMDIWTGSSTYNGGQDQINCEDALTPNPQQTVIRNPDTTLPVQTAALYSSGNCDTALTNPNPNISSFCGSGSGSGSGSCSWAGHCAGAPCQTYNDCSDALICVNGVCSSG